MTWPRWLRRAVGNRHRAIEQVPRRRRGGRRAISEGAVNLISTQAPRTRCSCSWRWASGGLTTRARELVERSIDAARRYAVAAQAKEPDDDRLSSKPRFIHGASESKAIGGDAAGASYAYQAALDALKGSEKPLPDQYGASVLGDRSRADFLRTERAEAGWGSACRRKGLGMGLYGSTGATTEQELQSALEVCELAISRILSPKPTRGACIIRTCRGSSRPAGQER